jgi:hypothetical protein
MKVLEGYNISQENTYPKLIQNLGCSRHTIKLLKMYKDRGM